MDLGQTHRGVDMGPSAVRYAGLDTKLNNLGHQTRDLGNLLVPSRYTLPNCNREERLQAICQACEIAYQAGCQAMQEGELPIFLGGDHSLSMGTIGGITHQGRAGVIWIDAHGDFNTPETSESGNIHGMTLAVLMGNGDKELVDVGRPGPKLRPEDVVMIGVRDLDRLERQALAKSGIKVYTMRDIDERGMGAVANEALSLLAHTKQLHVSLDLDCMDPIEAPGVGTPSSGGLTYREAQLLMEIIADSQRLASMDLVEINPILDQRNQTARVAAELTESLFGKAIL